MKNVTAASLLKNSNRQIVAIICNDIVKTVDELISSAHNQGFSKVEFELPVNFDINGMSKEDSQILIYSELIKIFTDDKGFQRVGLDFTYGKAILHIQWLNGMDEEEKKQRKQLIQNHLWKSMGEQKKK